MTPWTDRLLITVFLVCLVLPMTLTRHQKDAGPENRKLTSLVRTSNSMNSLSGMPRRIEAFMKDHFGFRKSLVRLYYRILVLYRDNSGKSVIIGKNRHLYYDDNSVTGDLTGQRMFTREELNMWKMHLTIKHKALRDIGIPYFFVLTPVKHSVYPEHLPRRYQPSPGRTRTDQWVEFMRSNTDVPIIDMHSRFKSSDKSYPLYSPTDTHWNPFGASIAAEIILTHLETLLADFKLTRYSSDSFDCEYTPGGDLANMLNLAEYYSDQTVVLKATNREDIQFPTSVMNALFARRNDQSYNPDGKYRLLLIGDSFIVGLFQLLSPSFNSILSIRMHDHQMRHIDPIAHFVSDFKPDCVVEVRVSRMLLDTVPEPPPSINIQGYPAWLKKYFILEGLNQEASGKKDKLPASRNDLKPLNFVLESQ